MKYGFFDEKELQSPKDSHKSPFPHVVRDELLNLLTAFVASGGSRFSLIRATAVRNTTQRSKVPCRIAITRKAWRRTFDRIVRD